MAGLHLSYSVVDDIWPKVSAMGRVSSCSIVAWCEPAIKATKYVFGREVSEIAVSWRITRNFSMFNVYLCNDYITFR